MASHGKPITAVDGFVISSRNGEAPGVVRQTVLPCDRFWAVDRSFEAAMKAMPMTGLTEQMGQLEIPSPMIVVDDVGVIDVTGPLEKGQSMMGFLFGGSSLVALRHAVNEAANDKAIKTILLRIDSPGGSVDGLAELGDSVFEARETKRIIAQVDGTAASAAYYVASQAHIIYSGRMDLVGSIGTRLVLVDVSAALADAGVSVIPIDSGPDKSRGLEGLPITEDDIDYFSGLVQNYFADFKAVIKRGRGDKIKDMAEVTTGGIFPAKEARRMGLVDRIQTFDETLAKLRQRGRNKARLNQAVLR